MHPNLDQEHSVMNNTLAFVTLRLFCCAVVIPQTASRWRPCVKIGCGKAHRAVEGTQSFPSGH